jgi:hypothetical protein
MEKMMNFPQPITITMTNMMPTAACLYPAGGRKTNGSQVKCMLKALRAGGVFADALPEEFSMVEQQTDND